MKILNKFSEHKTFILYAAIGMSGVLLDTVIFAILFNVVHIEKNVATIISISLAITNNFILNYLFNFKIKNRLLIRFAKFYAVGLSGIIMTSVLFYIFTDKLHISANYVKIGSLLPILFMQYSLNKFWTFRHEAA